MGKNNSNKSMIKRIPRNEYFYIEKCGEGNFRSGLSQIIGQHKSLMRDPRQILLDDIATLSDHARTLLSENHYEHFVESRVPAFLVRWVQTGKVDASFLKAPNKDLDSFTEEDGKQ